MKILVTGGTVFVSKFIANYFSLQGNEVFVLNRGSKPQLEHVNVIRADRHHLHKELHLHCFDAIIDVCAYNDVDINDLLDGLDEVKDYIMISSSAVYPETNPQPFVETQQTGENAIWKSYGNDKIKAEQALFKRVPHAYVLRPPYLYGPMQNLYREPFVFECARKHRPFYLPEDGKMKLQFFHVEDLCKLIQVILAKHPLHHILNVGNPEAISIEAFVDLCYQAAHEPFHKKYIQNHNEQRDYFSFYRYEYHLDVSKQMALLETTKDLKTGLEESYSYYIQHEQEVIRKPYIEWLDEYERLQ